MSHTFNNIGNTTTWSPGMQHGSDSPIGAELPAKTEVVDENPGSSDWFFTVEPPPRANNVPAPTGSWAKAQAHKGDVPRFQHYNLQELDISEDIDSPPQPALFSFPSYHEEETKPTQAHETERTSSEEDVLAESPADHVSQVAPNPKSIMQSVKNVQSIEKKPLPASPFHSLPNAVHNMFAAGWSDSDPE